VPGQQEVRWSQLKVGVLVIVALCALLALIFLMTNSSGGFWSGHLVLRSYFENSAESQAYARRSHNEDQ
jgi:phospholipid/cholesterol/gamma-HCH transport system substrate-binding protein